MLNSLDFSFWNTATAFRTGHESKKTRSLLVQSNQRYPARRGWTPSIRMNELERVESSALLYLGCFASGCSFSLLGRHLRPSEFGTGDSLLKDVSERVPEWSLSLMYYLVGLFSRGLHCCGRGGRFPSFKTEEVERGWIIHYWSEPKNPGRTCYCHMSKESGRASQLSSNGWFHFGSELITILLQSGPCSAVAPAKGTHKIPSIP